MLRVVHANRLDALVQALAESGLPSGDPFAQPTIVVSGHLVARWTTYALASLRGVAAHLDLPFLEAFVERTWTGDAPAKELRLAAMDQGRLAALVASVLADDEVTAGDAMEPVRGYLGDDDAATRQVRRVQLARRVAALIWEYALTRPDWLDAWEAGRVDPGDDVKDAATWAWQARLVHAIARATDRIAARPEGKRWIAAPRLPRARRALGLPPPRTAPVRVIGFSFLAPAYLDALGELAEHTDVTVFAHDPCEELWEDAPGRGRAPRGLVQDDARALTLWGRPARDTIARLVELSDGRLDDRFAEPGDATALAALRGDILHRRTAAPSRAADARPAGVTVLACPSLTRELEIVGSEIRRLLEADPTLRANDVAILAAGPRADRYLAQVPAVLGPLALPYHVVDAPLAEHGRVAEAALLLLELPLGRFARPELLRFMTHPAVLARHPHVDPEDWVEWAERLGIVHGASAADHAGTYLEREHEGELFHWDQGIKRLALGAFADPGDLSVPGGAAEPQPIAIGRAQYLPEPVAPDQQASAATFALLARSLLADAAWLKTQTLPLARWAEVLAALVDTYVGARDDTAARELAIVRGALARTADLDLDGREVGWAEVVELARGLVGGLRGDRGELLADGVMIAPLQTGRALPARRTFVVGLGEGDFPDTAPRGALDLRGDVRRGDVSRGDRDRYAFLECVLAPDDGLALSYVSRDLDTGDPIAPSSVVLELAEMLAPHLGGEPARALAALTTEHPLHRWDPRYDAPGAGVALAQSAAPARPRERHAIDLRHRLVHALGARGRAVPPPAVLADLLASGPVPRLRAATRLGPARDLLERPRGDDDPTIQISLSAVRRFLETPAQAWAQVVLRLGEQDDEDAVDRADEPFATRAQDRAVFLRDVFARHLGAGVAPVSLEAALEAANRARVLAGKAPVGVFGEVERDRDRDLLARWSRTVAEHGGAAPWRRYGFGKSPGAGCERHPAIAIDVAVGGRTRAVELVGWTELCGAQVGSLVLQPGEAHARHTVRGMFDAAILAAAGLSQTHAHLVLDKSKAIAARHAAWPQPDARAWLGALVGELLGRAHAYLLGVDEVKAIRKGNRSPRPRMRTDDFAGALGYGPLVHDDDLWLPDDAVAMVARRHGPLLDRMSGDDAFGNGGGAA